MCTFRASCFSARLSRAQVSAFTNSFVQDRKKKAGGNGGGGGHCLQWRVQGNTSIPTTVGSRRRCLDDMEFGMSRGIKPKRNMCTFQ